MPDHDSGVRMRPIGEVQPYPANAKKHPKKQIEAVAASIRAFGFNQPIVVDRNGVILVGHGRFLAAQSLGMEEIPVLVVDLDEGDANAYRLADNKLNESEWDMDLVIPELKGLTQDQVKLTGFNLDLVLLSQEGKDEAPPPLPESATSKRGEVYKLGEHRLMCGSATDPEDMKALMAGERAVMTFTDPPYGVSYESGLEDKASRMAAHRSVSRQNTQIENDTISDDEGLYDFLLNAFNNISVACGHGVYVCYASNRSMPFLRAWRDAGFHHASTIVWVKNRLVLGRGHYHYQYEPILYGWLEKSTGKWMGDRSQSNVWSIDRPSVNDLHPTMKPLELVTRAVVNSSSQGDIVLDPFGGSGSTLIACEESTRKCRMMEVDPRYVDVIIARWEKLTGQKAEKLSPGTKDEGDGS